MDLAITLLSFSSVLLIVLALGAAFGTARREVAARAVAADESSGKPGLSRWVLALCQGLAALHHGEGAQRFGRELEQRLQQAGRPLGSITGLEFLGLSELIGLATFATALIMVAVLGSFGPLGIAIALACGLLATWMTHGWLSGEVERRRTLILLQYPFFLDLAVMTMEEGASVSEALQVYCRDNPKDVLAEEFRLVLQEMRLGKMAEEAFVNMQQRVPSTEVRQSLTGVIQGQRMDSPLGEVFREQAEAMRFKRSQLAERMAEELKVKVMGPVVLMMIAILILILGPAFLGIANSGIVS